MSKSSTSTSTDNLLYSFPMFGQTGISALEYARGPGARHNNNSISVTSESLNRKSSASMRDESITPPTTADSQSFELDFSPPSHSKNETAPFQRRKGTFIDHSPRHFRMQSPKPVKVEVYQPSTTSIENYSRPRRTCQADFTTAGDTNEFQLYCVSPRKSRSEKRRLTINLDVPTKVGATEPKLLPAIGFLKPSKPKHANWSPLPVAMIDMYQPRSIDIRSRNGDVRKVQSADGSMCMSHEKNNQRQTPANKTNWKWTSSGRHTPLEPWVARHQRRGTDGSIREWTGEQKSETVDEVGPFNVIQRYFDSQTGVPVSSTKAICRGASASPPTTPLSDSSEPQLRRLREQTIDDGFIDQSEGLDDVTPVVPSQIQREMANPSSPHLITPAKIMDRDFALRKRGNYNQNVEILHGSKKYGSKSIKLGQVARASSSYVNRLAQPILSHDVLTVSSQGLNNLSNRLKQSGQRLEFHKPSRDGKTGSVKVFPVKQKKSLATRVGTVEGSPYRARPPVTGPAPASPTCTREMTTLGGVKHLKIIIPNESLSSNSSFPFVLPQSNQRRRSRQISIAFTEEMLNPLASPQIERILAGVEPFYHRSRSEPALVKWRTPKKAPKSSKPVPVNQHPLASREDQTRARKLRDLQHMKKKPLPKCTQDRRHLRVVSVASLKAVRRISASPRHSFQGKVQDEVSSEEDNDFEQEAPANQMIQLQNQMVLLQNQNSRLTEALAKVMGLSLQEGDLESEEVLQVFTQTLVAMRPIRE